MKRKVLLLLARWILKAVRSIHMGYLGGASSAEAKAGVRKLIELFGISVKIT